MGAGRFVNAVRGLVRPLGIDVTRYPVRAGVHVHVAEVLSELRLACVIDVGAHRGEFAAGIRGAGYAGRIVSFEPVAETYEGLEAASAHDPGWQVRRRALGAERGVREINVSAETAFSSFRSANATGREIFPGSQKAVGAERVEVVTLDEVFDECVAGLQPPRAFVKLDTQGWDLEVLAGATACLERIDALQIEVAVRPLYEGAPDFLESLQRLRELGFVPTGFFPVARAGVTRVLELDCVLTR
jgi:FkbM family methyltransferase